MGVRVFQDRGPHSGGESFGAQLLALIGFVGLCLLVQVAGAAVTGRGGIGWYLSLAAPPLTPPRWLFAPVWTALDILTGLAAWMVWRTPGVWLPSRRPALRLWGWQIGLTALWVPIFFGLRAPAAALILILILLAVAFATLHAFWQRNRGAALFLMPTCLWLCYAAYLNAGFWWLNQGGA